MSTIDAVNLGIAVFGATLGLFGTILSLLMTWREFDRDRVKLRVSASHGFGVGGARGFKGYLVTVLNLSAFPVTVNEVGFSLRGRTDRLVILRPRLADGGEFPRQLEPRTSVVLLVEPSDLDGADLKTIKHVYAKTACGGTGRRKTGKLFAKG